MAAPDAAGELPAMDDFEEIEGAGDPASPNDPTRQRNDTERNTNEVASMPTD